MTNGQQETKPKGGPAKVGTVTSTGGHKTIHVVVENLVKHPTYGKYVRRRTKLAVHDPQNQAALGDLVEIVPCRRLSKTKSWRLVGVIRRNTKPEGADARLNP